AVATPQAEGEPGVPISFLLLWSNTLTKAIKEDGVCLRLPGYNPSLGGCKARNQEASFITFTVESRGEQMNSCSLLLASLVFWLI
ncbi:hypothetical protein LEMLEM_LOCUS22242, partial [Lemmus lemmus]